MGGTNCVPLVLYRHLHQCRDESDLESLISCFMVETYGGPEEAEEFPFLPPETLRCELYENPGNLILASLAHALPPVCRGS